MQTNCTRDIKQKSCLAAGACSPVSSFQDAAMKTFTVESILSASNLSDRCRDKSRTEKDDVICCDVLQCVQTMGISGHFTHRTDFSECIAVTYTNLNINQCIVGL